MVGTILWAISGFVVNMACFIPVHMLEEMEPDQEFARQAVDAWAVVGRNVTASWAGVGVLMGFLTFLIFIRRPMHEHFTRAPMMDCRSPFAPPAGPKTMAEGKATIIVAVIGGALSVLMAVYLLPYFEHPGILVVKSVKIRVIIGFMQGALITVCILPFSLKIVEKGVRKEMRL